MQLKYVKIKNFRSIEEAKIEFVPRCRALIGINESGKTNLLDSLSLLSDDIEPDIHDVREPRRNEKEIEEAHVWFAFKLSKLDHLRILNRLKKQVVANSFDLPITIDGQTTLADCVKEHVEGLYCVDLLTRKKHASRWRKTEKTIGKDWLSLKATTPKLDVEIKGVKSSVTGSWIVNADQLDEEQLEHFQPLTSRKLASIVGDMVNDLVSDSLPKAVLWKYSDQQLLPSSIEIEEFCSAPEKYEPLRQMFALAGHEDVQEEIEKARQKNSGMRNLLRRVSTAATKHLRGVWKEYKGISISVEPNGEKIDVNIQDEFNLYDFSRRSDGFKRFISFIFLVSARTKNGELKNILYLHDEPDTGLHPSGSRHLRDELIKISKDNFVVYSTHSIFMIDRRKIGRHLIVTKTKEKTDVTQADHSNFRDEEVLYNALEFSTFQILRESNLLFEGWKDKSLFQIATAGKAAVGTQLREKASGFGTCHAQGVKDIPKVSAMLELAQRSWLVVSDGDKVAKERQAKYSWKKRWVRYDQLEGCEEIVTMEDFISEQKCGSVLKGVCKSMSVTLDPKFKVPEYSKLTAIRNELRASSVDVETTKEILDSFKDELLEAVKVSDIKPIYFTAMVALLNAPPAEDKVAAIDG